MRVYTLAIAEGRAIVTAHTVDGLELFRADFSVTEIEAALSFLREELKQEVGREIVMR